MRWLACLAALGTLACQGGDCGYSTCGAQECPEVTPSPLLSGRYVYTERSAGGGVPSSVDDTDGPLVLDIDVEAGSATLSYTRTNGEAVVATYTLDELGLVESY